MQMETERIKALREDRDLTQQAVAEYLQITRSTYSNYENGIREFPLEVLKKLADLYDTSLDYLLERTDEKMPYPGKKSPQGETLR